MPATKLQMNWTGVAFTPTGGTLTPITKVTDVQIDPGGNIKDFSGDADVYPTVVASSIARPKVTVTTSDVATIMGFSPGVEGTFAATFNDARLATGGAIVYSVIHCVVDNVTAGGAHSEFGKGTLTFMAYSPDGVTSPISFTRI